VIIERLVWRAKFGQGDTITAAFQRWATEFAPRFGLKARVLVDVTGPMFTVAVESEYRDMRHYGEVTDQLPTVFGEPEFQQWFGSWQAAVEEGTRELYRVLE